MDDRTLVKRVISGDQGAYVQLINRYQRLVAHMVARLIDDDRDREELAQDIFIKVYDHLGAFNFNSKLSTWIATIAYRHCVNFLKKNKKWKVTDLEETQVKEMETSHQVEEIDMAAHVRQLIEKLPEHYRVILTLYHLEGMSYPEIVKVMNMPEGTVKNYLFRARKKLKDLLVPFLQQEQLSYG